MFELARSFQIAWFIAGDFVSDSAKFFETVTGLQPSSIQHARPPQSPVPQSMLVGAIDGIQVRLHVQPGRADLYFEPDVSTFEDSKTFPALKHAKEVRNRILQCAKQASAILQNVYRLGFNAIYSEQFEDWEQAGKAFIEIIPSRTDMPVARDAVFQFNVRANKDGFELNRVLKWATENGQYIELVSRPGLGGQTQVLHEAAFVTYQVDLNNIPSEHILTQDEQIALLVLMEAESERLLGLKEIKEL